MYKVNSPNKHASDSYVLRVQVKPTALQAMKIISFP